MRCPDCGVGRRIRSAKGFTEYDCGCEPDTDEPDRSSDSDEPGQ